MISAVQSSAPSLFLNIARMQNLRGPVSVPVEPVYAVQAHFEHIQGVPSRGQGIPLFKLRLLDTLIDRLVAMRESVPSPLRLAALTEEEIEPVIASLERQLRSRVLQSPASFGGLFPETGMLVDLAA